MADRPTPGEDLTQRTPQRGEDDAFIVDLRRCIGCHACSVACKTAHDVPLGEFRLRVRWLPPPDGRSYAFVPVFSESRCTGAPESLAAGLAPACVRAGPTAALVYGERASAVLESLLSKHEVKALTGPEAKDLKANVQYIGLAGFETPVVHAGLRRAPRRANGSGGIRPRAKTPEKSARESTRGTREFPYCDQLSPSKTKGWKLQGNLEL